MKDTFQRANMKRGFHKQRKIERIAIYKPKRYNEFLSICYHIRNALAHGRLAMFPEAGGDVVFVLEDGVKKPDKFQVRSRMILKKSTLLRWIEIIENRKKSQNEVLSISNTPPNN